MLVGIAKGGFVLKEHSVGRRELHHYEVYGLRERDRGGEKKIRETIRGERKNRDEGGRERNRERERNRKTDRETEAE